MILDFQDGNSALTYKKIPPDGVLRDTFLFLVLKFVHIIRHFIQKKDKDKRLNINAWRKLIALFTYMIFSLSFDFLFIATENNLK